MKPTTIGCKKRKYDKGLLSAIGAVKNIDKAPIRTVAGNTHRKSVKHARGVPPFLYAMISKICVEDAPGKREQNVL